MLRAGAPEPLNPLGRARPRALAPVQFAPAVPHPGLEAGTATPGAGPAARSCVEAVGRLSSDFGEQAASDIWNPAASLAAHYPKPFNTFAVGESSAREVDGSVVSLVACSPKSPDSRRSRIWHGGHGVFLAGRWHTPTPSPQPSPSTGAPPSLEAGPVH